MSFVSQSLSIRLMSQDQANHPCLSFRYVLNSMSRKDVYPDGRELRILDRCWIFWWTAKTGYTQFVFDPNCETIQRSSRVLDLVSPTLSDTSLSPSTWFPPAWALLRSWASLSAWQPSPDPVLRRGVWARYRVRWRGALLATALRSGAERYKRNLGRRLARIVFAIVSLLDLRVLSGVCGCETVDPLFATEGERLFLSFDSMNLLSISMRVTLSNKSSFWKDVCGIEFTCSTVEEFLKSITFIEFYIT